MVYDYDSFGSVFFFTRHILKDIFGDKFGKNGSSFRKITGGGLF